MKLSLKAFVPSNGLTVEEVLKLRPEATTQGYGPVIVAAWFTNGGATAGERAIFKLSENNTSQIVLFYLDGYVTVFYLILDFLSDVMY